MLLNCGAGEDFFFFFWRRLLRVPWTARRYNQSNPKGNQPWILVGRTNTEAEAPILWPHDVKNWLIRKVSEKRAWERLKAGEGGDNREQDGWLASLTQWTWVWARSRRWWRTGKPGVLQFKGSQRVRHDWSTKQQQYNSFWFLYLSIYLSNLYIWSISGFWGFSLSFLFRKFTFGRLPWLISFNQDVLVIVCKPGIVLGFQGYKWLKNGLDLKSFMVLWMRQIFKAILHNSVGHF